MLDFMHDVYVQAPAGRYILHWVHSHFFILGSWRVFMENPEAHLPCCRVYVFPLIYESTSSFTRQNTLASYHLFKNWHVGDRFHWASIAPEYIYIYIYIYILSFEPEDGGSASDCWALYPRMWWVRYLKTNIIVSVWQFG